MDDLEIYEDEITMEIDRTLWLVRIEFEKIADGTEYTVPELLRQLLELFKPDIRKQVIQFYTQPTSLSHEEIAQNKEDQSL